MVMSAMLPNLKIVKGGGGQNHTRNFTYIS